MHIYHFFAALTMVAGCHAQTQTQITSQATAPTAKESAQSDGGAPEAIAKRTAAVRSHHTIKDAFADDKGDLWFSTNQGVLRYDGKSFTKLSTKDGLSDNLVTAIMQDRQGHMWFGVPDGMCRFDGKDFTHVAVPYTETSGSWLDQVYPVVNPNQVMSMLQDRRGDFWIATNGGGAYRYDGKTFTSFLADHGQLMPDGLHHNVILKVTEDTLGKIWFTSLSRGGVSRYDGTTMRHFTAADGLSDDMMRSAYTDKSGKVWVGSNGNRKGGLDRFDGKRFTNFHLADGLDSGTITAIFEDSKGKLWVGSQFCSLSIFDGERFTAFVTGQGQSFKGINFVLEDKQANIWFGGNHGQLFRYDGNFVTDFSIDAP